jgi:TANFOR domain-containing protein
MKNRFRNIVLALGLFVAVAQASAQSFAVQSTTQIIPPYSVYLSDYAAPGNEKLRVVLIQRDLTQPSYQIRLVMLVEWNGKVIMRTSRTFNPRPLSLDPGIPTIISGADLSPYLDSRNIDFIGYSKEQYERTKSLPEGSYRICFVAYDYRRQDVQVSNDGCGFYYLSKNEPPLANFPICNSKETVRTPQQLIFSWLPRNTASPTSAADTEYEFALYETRPAGRNPNDVVLTSQPVFRTITENTQLVYGPAEPFLIEGLTYVWRVRAIDKNGKDAFRNNGYSEVCTFRYGGFDPQFDVGVVKNLQAEAQTERRGRIWWETGDYEGYRVEYRKTGEDHNGEPYEWFQSDTRQGEITMYDLEPDTEYETRVMARKNKAYGPATEIIPMRTPPLRVALCGETTPPAPVDRSKPLLFATTGMVVNARGIEMTLVDVTRVEQDGFYKGIAKVAPKYLGGASFFVKFDKIFIDATRTVVGPERIDFITQGVAGMMQEQLAAQQQRQDSRVQEANRATWASTVFHEEIFNFPNVSFDSVYFDEQNDLILKVGQDEDINDQIRQLLDIPEPKAIIIQDASGDQWVVEKKDGAYKSTKVPGGGLNPTGNVTVDNQDLVVIRKALRELRTEYAALIRTYSLPTQAVDYSVALAIEYFSEETSDRDGRTLIAQNLKIGDKAVTQYLTESRAQNVLEATQVTAVKAAIVELVGGTMRSMMTTIDEWSAHITQEIGPNYRSGLGAGPLAYDPALLPDCLPTSKEDRAIVKDYFGLMKKRADELRGFFTSFFSTNQSTVLTGQDNASKLCRHSVEKAGSYFVRFKLKDLSFATECIERGYEKGKAEFFKSGIQMAFFAAQLEALICLTEKNQCANSSNPVKFGYGFANGLLQQLNIPEMRDALFELMKSTTENKLECLLNAREVSQQLATAREPKEVIKILTRCLYGIEVDVDQVGTMFTNAWTWIGQNYTDPYVQGQATAFIVTIVLPPVVKALQSVKLMNLLKTSRASLLSKLRSMRNLEGLEPLIDDVERGAAGAGNLLDDLYRTQRAVANQNKNIIASATSNAKGAFGEISSDALLTERGFQPHHPRKTALTDGWGETGIDGLFSKEGQYFVVESKYRGTATLKTTTDGLQMSDPWIRGGNRLINAVQGNRALADEILLRGYRRILAEVAPDGTIIYKELDAGGNFLRSFTP